MTIMTKKMTITMRNIEPQIVALLNQ